MDKPEDQPESEVSLAKVRAAKERSREHEVGYKLGKSLGTKVRTGWAVVLPFQMVLPPILVGGLGWWLDGKLGTSPGFTIGGLVIGLAVAVLSLIRSVKEVQ